MEALLKLAAANTAGAAVLAGLALLAARFSRRPALAHALWLLVLFKLVTPPLWAVAIPFHSHSAVATARGAAPHEAPDAQRDATGGSQAATKPQPETLTSPLTLDNAERLLCGTWLAGSLLCGVLAASRVRRLAKILTFAAPAPPDVTARANRLAVRIGLRAPPGVWFIPGAVSPMLVGLLGKPRLIVPDRLWDQLGPEQRDALLLHELAHLRRGDHLVRGFELLIAVLYWWNPLAWLARRGLRSAEEVCCDAWVTWAAPAGADDYAAALVETIDFVSADPCRPALAPLASGIGEFRHLHRRLLMIRAGQTPRTLGRRGTLACAAAALLLPLTLTRTQKSALAAAPNSASERADARAVLADAPATRPAADEDRANKALHARLDRQLPEISFNAVGLSDVIDFLRDVSGANIFVNWKSLETAGIDRNMPVTARLRNIKFSKALNLILDSVGGGKTKLAYTIDNGVITIGVVEPAAIVVRKYDVKELLAGRDDRKAEKLIELITGSVDSKSWTENGGADGMIKLDGSRLVVAQTEANQKAIATLLARTRDLMNKAPAPDPAGKTR